MDRISNYRQIRLAVTLARHSRPVSVSARIVSNGRVADREILKDHGPSGVPVESVWDVIDVLEYAVARLKEQHPRQAPPQGPESPEGTTGGPRPACGYDPEDPPLPGT